MRTKSSVELPILRIDSLQPIPSKLSIGSIPDDLSGHESFSNTNSENEFNINFDKGAGESTSI